MNQLIKRSANIVAASALVFGIGAATMFALPVFAEDPPSERNDRSFSLQPCGFDHSDISDHTGPNPVDLK